MTRHDFTISPMGDRSDDGTPTSNSKYCEGIDQDAEYQSLSTSVSRRDSHSRRTLNIVGLEEARPTVEGSNHARTIPAWGDKKMFDVQRKTNYEDYVGDISSSDQPQSHKSSSDTASSNESGENKPDRGQSERTIAGKQKHVRWLSHGKTWTWAALSFSIVGLVCAILSRRSIEFVRLKEPLHISQSYLPVGHVGMMRMELCSNSSQTDEFGCNVIRLSSEDVDDKIFQISRILITLATSLGGILTICLSTSIFWQSINLKPIALGFMLAYFLQSFSMVFFDTQICKHGNCRVGMGCILCIFSSLCWIGSCISTSKMDAIKQRQQRRRRRRAQRRAAKEAKLAEAIAMTREISTSTAQSSSSSASDDLDEQD